MKIFAISDMHGKTGYIEKAGGIISSSDLVVLGGDITHRGTEQSAAAIIDALADFGKPICAVHGNWDGSGVCRELTRRNISIHSDGRIIAGVGFFGVGGSGVTPFRTPCEYSEEEILRSLENGYAKVSGAPGIVLVSHTPPLRTRDRTFMMTRAGSPVIREFILAHKVDICICGHIHEAAGAEMLGDCLVVNPGPFRDGKYMEVEMDDAVSAVKGRFRQGHDRN